MQIQVLTLPQLADVLEHFSIQHTMNEGAIIVHEGTHQDIGACVVVQSACSGGAILIAEG